MCGEDNGVATCVEEGKITGVITAEINKEYKLLYVHSMLCITPSSTLTLCKLFQQKFHGYDIQAYRKGKAEITRYKKSDRLIKLLDRVSFNKAEKEST